MDIKVSMGHKRMEKLLTYFVNVALRPCFMMLFGGPSFYSSSYVKLQSDIGVILACVA